METGISWIYRSIPWQLMPWLLSLGHYKPCCWLYRMTPQIAKLMGPTWGPPGSCRPQMDPMLAPWTLLSGMLSSMWKHFIDQCHLNLKKKKNEDVFLFPSIKISVKGDKCLGRFALWRSSLSQKITIMLTNLAQLRHWQMPDSHDDDGWSPCTVFHRKQFMRDSALFATMLISVIIDMTYSWLLYDFLHSTWATKTWFSWNFVNTSQDDPVMTLLG